MQGFRWHAASLLQLAKNFVLRPGHLQVASIRSKFALATKCWERSSTLTYIHHNRYNNVSVITHLWIIACSQLTCLPAVKPMTVSCAPYHLVRFWWCRKFDLLDYWFHIVPTSFWCAISLHATKRLITWCNQSLVSFHFIPCNLGCGASYDSDIRHPGLKAQVMWIATKPSWWEFCSKKSPRSRCW